MITTIWGSTKKPVSSQQLATQLENNQANDGYLYIGYPIIGTPEGPFPIDALWVSPERGVIAFNLIEGIENQDDYKDLQDDCANKLDAKFRTHKALMNKRALAIELNIITFAPAKENLAEDQGYPICNRDNFDNCISKFIWTDNSTYHALLAVIQSISTIRKARAKRDISNANSRGAILEQLDNSIANLDVQQGRAVIETVEGVQRIRGLAGSGKTIVLALKAAYLHAQHPEWKIAVTFHTRSLKNQFRKLINTFAIEQTSEEPDWRNLHIIHAWGAPGDESRNGMYYNFCKNNGIEFFDYRSAKSKFGLSNEFEGACESALTSVTSPIPFYDCILVDEAQDLSPAFLKLCYSNIKNTKRLIYAYDELQSLNNKSLPSPEEIFGVNFEPPMTGKPKQDVILEKCYRNSRPILATAHALGFGIYRKPPENSGTGLIQMFDQSQLWLDVGYEVVNGELTEGHDVCLARNSDTSPLFLEDHSTVDDLIQFHNFDTKEEQAEWIANAIQENLENDDLNPEDIMVINTDPLTTRGETAPIRNLLFEQEINSHLAGVETSPDVFFRSNDSESITFTGIFRAKGNEAGMVYIINAQDCYSSFGQLATVRNRLFTALTRSKAWVRVLGCGNDMKKLTKEFKKIKSKNFQLEFSYPTAEERERLNIVNRDMTREERDRVKKGVKSLGSLLDDLEEGKVFIEDLDENQINRLKEFLREQE